LTSPVLRCIKKQRPDAVIHYLTKRKFAPLLEANPYIDRLYFLDDTLQEVLGPLRKEQYDLVIDLHHNLRTLLLKLDLGVRSHSFSKQNIRKYLTVRFRRNLMPNRHVVSRYLDTLGSLGITDDGEGLDYFIPAKDRLQVKDLPLTHLHGFVAMAIGGQQATKKMPVERLKEMGAGLTVPVILLGGPEDRANGEIIREGQEFKIFNGCGLFNINQSASLLQLSKKVITHDTGLMHIAAALKKEIISIWGNTIPEFGMSPYFGKNHLSEPFAVNSHIMEVKGLSCRPCSKLGKKKCPKGHFNCMNRIPTEEVIDLVCR